MAMDEEGADVLAEIEKAKARNDDESAITRRLRKEVKALYKKQAERREQGDDDDDEGVKAKDQGSSKTTSVQPTRKIDLSEVAFAEGGHTNTGQSVRLVDGTSRSIPQGKSWEEVHVPAPEPVKLDAADYVPISTLPRAWQAAFPSGPQGFKNLNPMQSKVFPCAWKNFDTNMLLCAPTGAGKTNVALLTMLNVLSQYTRKHRDAGGKETVSVDTSKFKMVYIAPMKALVQQLVGFFQQRLAPYDIVVNELSGDSNLSRSQIAQTQLIITTPEKWDIVTRRAGDEKSAMNFVRLVIIDEIHLLHDSRGPVLETIVARTIRHSEQTQEPIRLVGLSATLPNYRDVASFMRVTEDGLFRFDGTYRPCTLEQTFIGITDKKAVRRLKTQNDACFEKVMQAIDNKKQVLIFVHARKETVKTAKCIRDLAMDSDQIPKFVTGEGSRQVLKAEYENLQSQDLKELISNGIAVHHAGMGKDDRKIVEELFSDKHIQVLVSTATLAWGVNLPAHTVIIKGTNVYRPDNGKWEELSILDMMQMMGRAGRPGMETSGHGIVITEHKELQYYMSLMNMQLPIESQMIADLPDKLIGELCLGSIQDRADAVEWLGYTYLFVRMQKAPHLYGVSQDEEADPALVQARTNLIHAALGDLHKNNMIRYAPKTGQIQVTYMGRVASQYYIRGASIATYNENLRENMDDIELLHLL